MKGQPKISSIYSLGESDLTAQEKQDRADSRWRHFCAKLWRRGIYVRRVDEIDDDFLRQSAINDGNREYGKRSK